MILKPRLGDYRTLILLGAVVLLSGFSIARRDLKEEIYSAYDPIMAMDPGFSSMNRLGRSFPEITLNYLSSLPKIVGAKMFGHRDGPEIPAIEFNIKFKNYETILADRARGIQEGFLRDPTEVDAQLVYQGKRYKAGVRLKGDISDHWRSRSRMSLRVDLKGDKTIMGFSSFSIHKPSCRQHPYDQVFQDMVKEMGNLSPARKFATVTVNGEKWGIMDIEEHMSKELLEKQRSKESLIMRFSNEDYFLYRDQSENPFQKYLVSNNNFYTKPYSAKKYFADGISRRRFSYASFLLIEERYEELFDHDSMMQNLLLASAWGNFHALAPSNSRYYFNPYDLRLHPITTDQGRFYDIDDRRHFFTNPVYNWFLDAPGLDEIAQRNLQAVQGAVGSAEKLFAHYNGFFPADQKTDTSILFSNLDHISRDPSGFFRDMLEMQPREKLVGDYVFDFGQGDILPETEIEQQTPTVEQVREMLDFVHIRHLDDGTVEIYNLLPVDVQLTRIIHNGVALQIKPQVVPAYGQGKTCRPLVLQTGILGIQDGLFSVETELLGVTRTTSNEFTFETEGLENPLHRSFSAKTVPFLQEVAGNFVARQGTWHIKEPITVTGNLSIPQGTELRFSPDSYLIVKGSLETAGTRGAPVKILPEETTFKGVYVFKAGSPSRLTHTIIGKTSGVEDGLLQLTGGVTFYQSNVHMDNVTFLGTVGEDALNIVESKFSIRDSNLTDARSDGVDCDFSNGVIDNSEFSSIGGDAVDFSGSVVEVTRLNAHDIKDKAVSVGEGSIVRVRDGVIHDVGVGVASKDGSFTTAENLEISRYHLHGAMTYTKKSFFVQPELLLSKIKVSEGDRYFRQVGSSLMVDGSALPERKINVKELYQGAVMKK